MTNFSNRYEVADIDPAQDRISSQKDDEWNRKLLEMLGEGRLEDVAQVARDFAREANADMGFKAIWWLGAVMGEHNRYDGKVWDYQPVWGTGNAIVELTPNERKQMDWEKEFDEGPVPTFARPRRSGTGLETHNVLAEGATSAGSEMNSEEDRMSSARTSAPKPVGPVSACAARRRDAVPLRHRPAQAGHGRDSRVCRAERPATTSRCRRVRASRT